MAGEEDAAALDPQQGVQQTGRQGGGRGARAGGRWQRYRHHRATRPCISSTTWPRRSVTLLEDYKVEPRPLRWASPSPDKKAVIFARNHNLYMMDAENYAKAVRNAERLDDCRSRSSRPTARTTTASRAAAAAAATRTTSNSSNSNNRTKISEQEQREEGDAKNARVAPVGITWSRDSTKFSAVRRDVRKVKDLWVINPLANPRPTLETYRYAMPGDENTPQSEMYIFDIKSKGTREAQGRAFQDQTVNIATKPQRAGAGAAGGGRGGGAGGPQVPPTPQEWLYDGLGQDLLHAVEPRYASSRCLRR